MAKDREEPAQGRYVAALSLCAALALLLPLPWVEESWYHRGMNAGVICADHVDHTGLGAKRRCCREHRHGHEPEGIFPSWVVVASLLAVATCHTVALAWSLEAGRARRLLFASGAAMILCLIASRAPHWLLIPPRGQWMHRHPALWAFALVWLALFLVHFWELPRFTWWLATGPRRGLAQEIASAAGLAVFPAAVLAGYAALAEAIWPGALEGGGLLLVPARVAVVLCVSGGGFGLALWYRLTRP